MLTIFGRHIARRGGWLRDVNPIALGSLAGMSILLVDISGNLFLNSEILSN